MASKNFVPPIFLLFTDFHLRCSNFTFTLEQSEHQRSTLYQRTGTTTKKKKSSLKSKHKRNTQDYKKCPVAMGTHDTRF